MSDTNAMRERLAILLEQANGDAAPEATWGKLADAALAAGWHDGPSAIPEGWRLVPVEPTPEMYIAGGVAGANALNSPESETYADMAVATYAAMIAAAPSPPAGGDASVEDAKWTRREAGSP